MAEMNASKDKVGVVISNRMQKTVVVRVDRLVKHAKFKRVVRRSKTYKVHDEKNQCSVGDQVRIRETRPLSAQKYHTLVDIVAKVKVQEAQP